jgi:hypothetical protein
MKYIDIFNKELDDFAKKSELGVIFWQLFQMTSDESLERELEYIHNVYLGKDDFFKEYGKEEWFAIWHKSVRQTDYFQDCYQETHMSLLSKTEYSRLKFLQHKFYLAPQTKEEKEKVKNEFKDEHREYFNLTDIRDREKKRKSIGGRIDSILWNIVCIDNKGELPRIFRHTFSEVEFEEKEKLEVK